MKKLIRKILQRYGYDIIKTDHRYAPKGKGKKTVLVGKYEISMPANNIQLENYRLYPDLNAQMGKLALLISQKYPGMTTIDVGANVGDTIAVLKSWVDIPVIGIEGDDSSFAYLEKNVRQFKEVSIVKAFLGEKKKELNVALEKEGWNTTIVPDANGEVVSFQTLDDVVLNKPLNNTAIKLLKVDVEGFDTIVLRGASELIEQFHPVLFFEYNRDNMRAIEEDGLSTLLSFARAGYNKIVFFDHKGRLLISTSLKNESEIRDLHHYAIGANNLLGYYDICIFHQDDTEIGDQFVIGEKPGIS